MSSDSDTNSVFKQSINEAPTIHPCVGIYRPEIDVATVDEKKLMWKVDLHVIPWLSVLYLFSFLDRGSIGNAKVVLFQRQDARC